MTNYKIGTEEFVATGYAFDPATQDWTKPVEYVARDEMEAIRWCNFNRDWMKGLVVRPRQAFYDCPM
jgi:hypothetical protein